MLFIALSSLIGHAQTSSPVDTQHVNLDTISIMAQAGAPVYRAAAPRVWEIKNTRIALTFDWKQKTADAKEYITLHPYFYPTDTLVLDAKSMRIDSVLLKGTKGSARVKYSYENAQLKIYFDRKYCMNETIELYLKYTAMPYDAATGGSGAITDDRGLYFINTDYSIPHKPAQIWTQGETESNSHWLITIDKPNTRFTTQVELTVPDSFTTLSNGAMVKQVKGAHGMRTDIWKMDMPIQAYVVMFAIGKFAINRNTWRGKEVNYYTEPEYAPYAYLMFNHTTEMLELFSKRTGVVYPWNKYSQVVVRDYVSGAMENTSAALFGEFMNQNAREIADHNSEDVVAHELFHEWFGDYVTCESWSNITVNESFANYGEQLWRNYKYGKSSGDELAWNDLQGYVGGSSFYDPQLVRFYYDNREEVFDHISYNKGGAVLRYLNTLIGDVAFDEAMRLYLTKNALHSAEAHHWRLAVEEATGQDWNWFFNEWYYHGGHPVVNVVYTYNDTTQKLTVTVTQTQEDSTLVYRLPLKVAVFYGGNKTITDWNLSKKQETFTYDYHAGVRPFIIPDVEHALPGELKDGKKMEQWRQQFLLADDYVSRKLAISAAGKQLADSNSQAIMAMALRDPLASNRRNAITQLGATKNEKYQQKWTEYVIYLAKNDSNKQVRAIAFETLGDWNVESAKGLMAQATAFSSYTIAGAALEALTKVDKDTAYSIARKLVNNEPKSSLENAVWEAIGAKAADDDIALYEKHAPYFLGIRKFTIALSLATYLKSVKSDDAFTRGVSLFQWLITTATMKAHRARLASSLFAVAATEKDNAKSEKKEEAEVARRRLAIVKAAMEKVMAAENDPELTKSDEKKMKSIFE
jgi:aminopeptidase N